ncbi:ATP-binding cassette domain-containing protein [Paenibacillus sp. KQZ6P-2]|uniref:ATP-binding cassette domain-containing protein n=1 Tax=Paenibacillus mangrovi TaxID=2931978 RepID=A0A9X1WR66_9BACL|nr:ATP-binding cassette domain-containing protein [Paenibacillus mangrovi]MCJ8011900.1 ATP-binding cassette domain-containing protein [Paenibacillus mangrovi]
MKAGKTRLQKKTVPTEIHGDASTPDGIEPTESIENIEADMVVMEKVSFAYDGQCADIHNVSLSIGRGEWVTLAGANGSGKSTLIRLMNGLLRAGSGSITIGGTKLEPGAIGGIRQKVGMVFQNPDNQFIGATVEEDMAFGLEGLCLDAEEMRSRISRYASSLGISDLLHRHPQELSGGQKQRAAVAAILAMEPELIILDEASSMLDEMARRDWLSLLREMHSEGRYTLLSITHDAEEIAASERVLVMHEGKLAADLMPGELFRSEELLRMCRMVPPFRTQLALELEKRGIRPADAGLGSGTVNMDLEDERIWPFSWNM